MLLTVWCGNTQKEVTFSIRLGNHKYAFSIFDFDLPYLLILRKDIIVWQFVFYDIKLHISICRNAYTLIEFTTCVEYDRRFAIW